MKKCFVFLIGLFLLGLSSNAQMTTSGLRTIEIGTQSTTHVIFMTDLTYVDISNMDVIFAKVVDKSKNILALKARCEFDFVTTISALESNGAMHTFKVRYNSFPPNLVVDTRQADNASVIAQVNTQIRPDGTGVSGAEVQQPQDQVQMNGKDKPKNTANAGNGTVIVSTGDVNVSSGGSNFGRMDAPTLEEVMRKDQQLFHIGDKSYKLEAYCTNVFSYSDLMYFVLSLKNGSDIGYESGEAQFVIESKTKSGKNLVSTRSIWPKNSFGTLSCPPKGNTVVAYSLPKITLLKDEVLNIYIYEKGGNRNLLLTLTDKDVNFAVSPI